MPIKLGFVEMSIIMRVREVVSSKCSLYDGG